jgi:hypothetical protein
LIDIDLSSDADQDGDGNPSGLVGLLGINDILVDGTVGGGDTDGDDEHGSLVDLDTEANTGGDVGGDLLNDDLLGGELLGGDLLGGDLLGGALPGGDLLGGDLLGGNIISGDLVDGVIGSESDGDDSLLNVRLDTGEDTDNSVVDIGVDELLGDGNAVSEVVETVEDTVDQVAGNLLDGVGGNLLGGDLLGGDLLGGDLLGGDLLGGLDIGETLAQLGSGNLGLLDGVTEDLADVGAITGIVDEVVDTAASTVDRLLGENDLSNILDTDSLLGDG